MLVLYCFHARYTHMRHETIVHEAFIQTTCLWNWKTCITCWKVRKRTFRHVRSAKVQVSLHLCKLIGSFAVSINPSLAEHDMPCPSKQCRSRSVGLSQLIWICTVCHQVCEFIATIQIKHSDWLKIRSGRGILIYSAWEGIWFWISKSAKFLYADKEDSEQTARKSSLGAHVSRYIFSNTVEPQWPLRVNHGTSSGRK